MDLLNLRLAWPVPGQAKETSENRDGQADKKVEIGIRSGQGSIPWGHGLGN